MHGIHSSRQVIEIPRHSIVRLEFCGNENLIGDTNSDGSVNVLDIVMIVSFIVGDLDLTPNQLTSSDFNQDSIVWSHSCYNDSMKDIDLSKYYSDDWYIGFQTITDNYGNEEFISVYFEDTNLNIWFGTNK